jgi:uncharacterized protein YbjT (DUF2867 family)
VIAVAGGSGRLGREVVRRLLERGARVRVLSREPEAARAKLPSEVDVVRADLTVAASLPAALSGVETVVSAVTGFGIGGQGTAAVDERGNQSLMDAAQAAGVRRFVLVSMHGAAPDHAMELMRRKHAAERHLRASSLDWVVVRPTPSADLWVEVVGGPIAAGKKAPVFGAGDNLVNWVAQSDVAWLVVRAAEADGLTREVVSVGGPDNVSLNELARRIAARAGRPAGVLHVPVPVLRLARVVLRPMRPDLAGMVEGGIALATEPMAFDPSELRARFPELKLTPLDEVIDRTLESAPAFAPSG